MSLPSRRTLLYVLVGLQLAFLGGIVAVHELNRALDWGPGVSLEIPRANASKDPFRGAAVSGYPALDLHGTHVAVPAGLAPGDAVLVFFATQSGKPPRIVQVERRRWGADPLFGPELFSIPGRVVGKRKSTGAVQGALASFPGIRGAGPSDTSRRRCHLDQRRLRPLLGTGTRTRPPLPDRHRNIRPGDHNRPDATARSRQGVEIDRRPSSADPALSDLFFDGSGKEVASTKSSAS
jgi:hypothetical protein